MLQLLIAQAVPLITAEELQSMIEQDHDGTLFLLDVRSQAEYDQG